jgi:4-amino-4-deoxy-L-arabinose transferase-like glycosyltransferase
VTVWTAHLVALTWASLVLAAATSAGSRCWRVMGWRFPALHERVVLSAGMGLALLGYLVWAVGIAGLLTEATLWGVVLVLAAAGAGEWAPAWHALARSWGLRRWRPRNGRAALLIGVVAVQGLMIVVANLAPPTAGDPLMYLPALRQYLHEGRIVWWPITGWNMPQLSEMLTLLALGTGGEIAAGVAAATVALVAAAAMWSLARRYVSPTGAVLAAATLMSTSHFYTYATSLKVEPAMILFLLLGWRALLHWHEGGGDRWLVLAGLCAGLTASTKYTGVLAAAGLAVAAALAAWRARRVSLPRGRSLRAPVLAATLALVAALPWYGRNWLHGGDPIWPLGYAVFKSRYYTAAEHQKFAAWELGAGTTPLSFLLSPWTVTTRSRAYATQDFRTVFTPIFLAFLPGLVLTWTRRSPRRRSAATLLLVGAAVSYTGWFLGGYQKLDYLVPLVAPLIVVTALAAEGMWALGRPARLAITGGVAVACSLALGVALLQVSGTLPYVLGRVDRVTYLRNRVSFYDDYRWVNATLPPDARVLSLDLHPYYVERALLIGAPAYSGLLDYPTLGSPQDLLARLRALRVDYILVPTRPLDAAFAKASQELWPEASLGELAAVALAAGAIVQIYRNPAARTVHSRTFGWERRSQYFVYAVRHPGVSPGR